MGPNFATLSPCTVYSVCCCLCCLFCDGRSGHCLPTPALQWHCPGLVSVVYNCGPILLFQPHTPLVKDHSDSVTFLPHTSFALGLRLLLLFPPFYIPFFPSFHFLSTLFFYIFPIFFLSIGRTDDAMLDYVFHGASSLVKRTVEDGSMSGPPNWLLAIFSLEGLLFLPIFLFVSAARPLPPPCPYTWADHSFFDLTRELAISTRKLTSARPLIPWRPYIPLLPSSKMTTPRPRTNPSRSTPKTPRRDNKPPPLPANSP